MGQIWEISGTKAICLSVTNARQGPGTYFEAELDEDIFDAIRRSKKRDCIASAGQPKAYNEPSSLSPHTLAAKVAAWRFQRKG
jgi:hypothetical protein